MYQGETFVKQGSLSRFTNEKLRLKGGGRCRMLEVTGLGLLNSKAHALGAEMWLLQLAYRLSSNKEKNSSVLSPRKK